MFHTRWRLGRVLPSIIGVVFLLDIAARFMPLEWLTFRAWEALVRFRAPCGPFRANASYDEARAYGDLAAMGNLPNQRVYRHETFTTDSHGYRQNSQRQTAAKEYKILIIGDSFGVGSTVSDHETLPARLERNLTFGVYNGAGGLPIDLPSILSLAQRLNMKNGMVLYEYIGRGPLPGAHEYNLEIGSTQLRKSCNDWKNRMSSWLSDFREVSPLDIIAEKLFKKLQNDYILPNVLKNQKVVYETLKDGDSILFFRIDIAHYQSKRTPDARGLIGLARELQKHNLQLVVLLVPDKYIVYAPLIKNAGPGEKDKPVYLDLVEKSLKEAQIPVINLVGFLRRKAHEYYQERQFIYWPDDTHWNAEGIRLAAEEILRQNLID
jgi:hypothetical protein